MSPLSSKADLLNATQHAARGLVFHSELRFLRTTDMLRDLRSCLGQTHLRIAASRNRIAASDALLLLLRQNLTCHGDSPDLGMD